MKKPESFPFALEQDAVAAWLSQLNEKDLIASGTALYAALKQLSHVRPGDKDLLAPLDLLTPSVLHISGSLLAPMLPAADSINPKSRKLARLSSQLLRYQCLAYRHAATTQKLNDDRKTSAIFTALQFAGLTMRADTLTSEPSSSSLWQLMGELYRIARKERLINLSLSSKIPLFKPHKSIASVLKRNLLFALFNPYPAPSERIIEYFDLADRCADLVAFDRSQDTTHNFYWNGRDKRLRQDIPEIHDENSLVFNTEEVTRHLLSLAPETEPRDAYFFTLRQKLSAYQDIIDSVILSKPEPYCYTVGITAIGERLKHLERIFKIHRLSGPMAKADAISKMELIPMESEFKMLSPKQMHLSQESGKSLKIDGMNLQETKFSGYVLGHAKKNNQLSNGEPVLLYNEQAPPRIGIIRNVIKSTTPLQQVLIQLLAGETFPIQLHTPTTAFEALLIKTSAKNQTVLLPPGKYPVGETLTLAEQVDRRYCLGKLIEEGEHFMHYRLDSD